MTKMKSYGKTRKGHVPVDGRRRLEVSHLASADREATDDENADEGHFDEGDTNVKASTHRVLFADG